MSRKQLKRTAGKVAVPALAGFFILVAVVSGIGFSVASADSADDLVRVGAFGYNEATTSATMEIDPGQLPVTQELADDSAYDNVTYEMTVGSSAAYEKSVLARTTTRDLSNGFLMIDNLQQAERDRIARENALVFDRIAKTKAINGVSTNLSSNPEQNTADQEYGLMAVDWTVGMEQFVADWSERLDAYLAGSALEGYGTVFAQAAWDNGIDPRWSAAISCIESGKAASCFCLHNAWGWGHVNWPDWETAIREHAKGLAEGYGYSVTPEGARKYNYETPADWYAKVKAEMAKI